VLALFGGELLKHRPAAGVFRQAGGARVELEAAALRGNRHPEASRANTSSVVAPSIGAVFVPVRHCSQVP